MLKMMNVAIVVLQDTIDRRPAKDSIFFSNAVIYFVIGFSCNF